MLFLLVKNGIFTTETFNRYKDLIHPNIVENVDMYRKGKVITLPPYHGCHYANRNGTRKLIDYGRGEQCVLPTNKRFWKIDVKDKYMIRKAYFTRCMTIFRLSHLAKSKGHSWYNHGLKKYVQKLDW